MPPIDTKGVNSTFKDFVVKAKSGQCIYIIDFFVSLVIGITMNLLFVVTYFQFRVKVKVTRAVHEMSHRVKADPVIFAVIVTRVRPIFAWADESGRFGGLPRSWVSRVGAWVCRGWSYSSFTIHLVFVVAHS